VKIKWLLRGSAWRRSHLLLCFKCYKRFERDAAGAINAVTNSDDELVQCLQFGGFSELVCCPACAAPRWREAVAVALYRRHLSEEP